MLDVRDPADLVGEMSDDAADVAAARALARTAFVSWRRTRPLDRAPVPARCADLFIARVEEQGAPARATAGEVRHQW